MGLVGWTAVALLTAGKVSLFAISVRNALRPKELPAMPGDHGAGPPRDFSPSSDDSHDFPLLPS